MSKAVAKVLFMKAQHDLNAADLVLDADPKDIGIQVFGFHVQQAVEKAAKALLAWNNVKYPLTHEVDKLFAALDKKGISVPPKYDPLINLTPFAEIERYEAAVPRTIDRDKFMKLAREFLVWIGAQF